MEKIMNVSVTIYLLLYLAINYTFSLDGKKATRASIDYSNNSWRWNDLLYHGSVTERSKKMASNIGHALRKIKDSAQDIGRNISYGAGIKKDNHKLSDEDVRQYEQMVIIKKYPFIDFKELVLKYSPLFNKNTRQSVKFQSGTNFRCESNLYEPQEGINVEITNRGLSGFAIPPKLTKTFVNEQSNVNNDNGVRLNCNSVQIDKLHKNSSKSIKNLLNDIVMYEFKMNR